MRTCKTCGETKDAYMFSPRTNKKTGVEHFRKDCTNCRAVKDKEGNADRWLEREYGISRAQWELILKSQNGKCKLCGKVFDSKINVDHDHETQVVRGLLCNNCNRVLRYFDDPTLFEKFTDYVGHSNALKELYRGE